MLILHEHQDNRKCLCSARIGSHSIIAVAVAVAVIVNVNVTVTIRSTVIFTHYYHAAHFTLSTLWPFSM